MIPLIKNTFFNSQVTSDELSRFIRSADKLSMGQWCSRFEDEFKQWHKRKHAVLVNSGSSANLALIQAMLNLGRLKKGDNVGFSALTWATNVMPLIQLGLNPVPIDIELSSLNVSMEKLAGKDIKALFITNLLGGCHDIDVIAEYCKNHAIYLLEDNCESLGTRYMGELLGNYGIASTFSFYVGHHLSTIEGGMVLTNDDELANMLKMVRAHGWKRDLDDYDNDFYGRYTFYDLGYNLRPTEITGFLGSNQLKYLDEIIFNRMHNFDALSSIYGQNGILPYRHKIYSIFSSFCFPIVCETKERRDFLLKKLDGIAETRPIVGGNITKQPFFIKYVGEYDCPNAEFAHKNGFYFGNNPDMTSEDIELLRGILHE